VVVLHVLDLRRRLGFLELLLGADLHRHQQLGDVAAHRLQQALEQLEGLALVFLLRVLLRIAAQMDALAQVVERREVLAPVGVEALQHHVALELVPGGRIDIAVLAA
jgi:hypothetical protein